MREFTNKLSRRLFWLCRQLTLKLTHRFWRTQKPRITNYELRIMVGFFALAITLILNSSFLIPSSQAAAGINQQINFQARLFNAAGAVVPDGDYNIEFKIYCGGNGVPGTTAADCNSATDEQLLWTESRLNNNSQGVTVRNGYFSVQLGSITALSAVDFNDDKLWLSLNVGSTNTTCTPFSNCTPDGEMNPMQRFGSNAYAFNAQRLDGLLSSAFGQLASNQTWTGTNTLQPTTNITALVVRQTSAGSPTADVLKVQNSSGNEVLSVTSTGAVTLGKASTVNGALVFRNSSNANTITLQSGVTAASGYTLTLPTALGSSGDCIKDTTGAGVLGFGTCGAGTVTNLQTAYDGSSTPAEILLASAKNFVITSPDVATDPNILFNLQCTTCSANGGRFAVQSAGTDVLTVSPDGNVGIGQIAPARPLHISSAGTDISDGGVMLIDSTLASTTNQQAGIRSAPYIGPSAASSQSYYGVLGVPNTNNANLSNASLVGLSSAPYIYGSASVGTVQGGYFQNYADNTSTITNSRGLVVENPSKAAGATITSNTGIEVRAQTAGGNNMGLSIGEATGTNQANLVIGQITQPTGTYSIYNSSPDQNYFAGNVGIGQAVPTSVLHTVASGAKTTNYTGNLLTSTATSSTASINKYGLEVQSTGTWNGTSANNVGLYVSSVTGGTNNYDAIFNGGGYVGIGTAAPANKLEVIDSAIDVARFTSTSGTGGIVLANNGAGSSVRIRAVDNGGVNDLLFLTGGSERVRVDAAGNVGIGTTGPTSLLAVQGTQPVSQAGNGTAATQVLAVTGAKGGNTSGTANTAGVGASAVIQSGAGGDATAGSGSSTAGAGGGITIQAGAGGVNSNAANANANGGDVTIQGGAPGTGGTGGLYGNVLVAASGGVLKVGGVTNATLANVRLFVNIAEVSTTLRIGDATNGVEFSGSSAPVYRGTARPIKRLSGSPEFAGAVLRGDGSNNVGTMTTAFDATNFRNYYKWTTSQATNQDFDVVVRVPVPQDYSGFTLSQSFCLYGYTTDTTNGTLTATVYDSANTAMVFTGTSYTPGSASTWAETCHTIAAGSPTITPGGYITIRVTMQSPQNGDVRLGEFRLDYLARF
jgi:hypothetical protein